jgi:hypothetical protein
MELDFIGIKMPGEISALQMYKDYIDNLAKFFSKNSVIAGRVLTKDEIKYSTGYEFKSEEIDDLLGYLNPDQTRIFGHMILGERCAGIHGTLHSLDERIDIEGLRLTFNGKPMITSLDSDGLMGNYVTRWLGYDLLDDKRNLDISDEDFISVLPIYRDFIDHLANIAKNSILAIQLLTENDIKYSPSYESRSEDTEELIKYLNAERKQQIFGRLLLEERHCGIRDALHSFDELINRGLRFILNGELVPTGLAGKGLVGDYMLRYHGHEFPNNTP